MYHAPSGRQPFQAVLQQAAVPDGIVGPQLVHDDEARQASAVQPAARGRRRPWTQTSAGERRQRPLINASVLTRSPIPDLIGAAPAGSTARRCRHRTRRSRSNTTGARARRAACPGGARRRATACAAKASATIVSAWRGSLHHRHRGDEQEAHRQRDVEPDARLVLRARPRSRCRRRRSASAAAPRSARGAARRPAARGDDSGISDVRDRLPREAGGERSQTR